MRLAAWTSLLLAVALGCANSALAQPRKPRMVVLSIKAIDEESRRPAQVLSEILLTDLSKLNRLEILGESEIGSLVGFEKQKELLGCTEGSCLAQIGGALGCEYLIMGTLGRVGNKLRLDLKLADVRKSVVLARDGSAVSSADDLEDAARRALKTLVDALPGARPAEPPPAERAEPPPAQPVPSVSAAAGSGHGALPWVLIGTGGAALVGGGALTGISLADKRNLTFSQARTRTTAGEVVAGVGLAAIAAGIVVYALTGGEKPEPKAAVTVAPSASGAALVFAGKF